ncbi:MAG: 4Fe-4S binding protein [Candidatus Lokiarchaeota archaeon]|nr:4Fe-4S binding protein [Candidatus Lokiarchaeota archaeon]
MTSITDKIDKNGIVKEYYEKLEVMGYQGKIVSAKNIPDLQKSVKHLYEEKLLDPIFYGEYKDYFEFQPEVEFGEILSLFIITVPQPQYKVIFHWNKKEIPLIIPPTYLHSRDVINRVKAFLTEILKPKGYNVEFALVPQKTLAVRTGLAEYGRNNITYVQGMGSFHRPSTFYSDFPYDNDDWQELCMMDLCKECSACIRACPTGTITEDRFLIHVERCLTFHNEHPAETSFPDWIDPLWHNCLVGCMHCQKVCPANKKVMNWVEPGPTFSEEETKLLVSGAKVEELPVETRKKIEEHDLENYLYVYPRNLGVILKRY